MENKIHSPMLHEKPDIKQREHPLKTLPSSITGLNLLKFSFNQRKMTSNFSGPTKDGAPLGMNFSTD